MGMNLDAEEVTSEIEALIRNKALICLTGRLYLTNQADQAFLITKTDSDRTHEYSDKSL